jgi:Cytochrome P460
MLAKADIIMRSLFIRFPSWWLVLVATVAYTNAPLPVAAAAEWSTENAARVATISTESGPVYESDGRLKLPANYREWIFLSSGLDMSYSAASSADHSMFDNVFAEPTAYREFVRTGTWPDGTSLLLEARGATSKGSINQHGKFQNGDVMGVEIHVKDTKRFQGGWAFFSFDSPGAAKRIPATADCYSCHQQHAAVDTTFVQFYPTLLSIATLKGTLSPGYKP